MPRMGESRSLDLRRLASWTALLAVLGCDAPGTQGPNGRVLLHPNGDVLAAGSDVRLSESVTGDAMTAGRSVLFDGATGGSYVGAGGEQDVRGRIDGSVRAAGGSVRVSASVGRNITVAGGSVQLERGAEVARNAYLAGGSISVEGAVRGDAYVGGGDVVLDGIIDGNVRVEAGHLTVGPNARLGGDLRFRTEDGTAVIDPGARIEGGTEALAPRDEPGPGGEWMLYVLRVLAFIVTGTVVVALAPGTMRALEEKVSRRPTGALGLGLLWIFGVPLAILVTALTLVGLPLAGIAAVLYAVSLYLAPVVPAEWLGGALRRGGRGDPRSPRRERLARFLWGGPIVAVVILLPAVGLLARLVAVSLGLGATTLVLFSTEDEGAAPRS